MIERIQQAHALYCRLTGQRVSLRFDRERLWYSSKSFRTFLRPSGFRECTNPATALPPQTMGRVRFVISSLVADSRGALANS